MNPWNESGIGIVYFAGILLSLIAGLVILNLMKPVKSPMEKISGKQGNWWLRTFISTLMIVSLAGALSVSFRDCSGNYDHLLQSRKQTVMKGMQQVSTSMDYLAWTLLFWLLLLLILYIVKIKNKNTPIRPGK